MLDVWYNFIKYVEYKMYFLLSKQKYCSEILFLWDT